MEKVEFEKQLKVLQEKLNSIKKKMSDEEKNKMSPLINELEKNSVELENEINQKITPIERVKIARHPNRPTTLDYINCLIKNFIQFHGDRRFMDDQAIIGGVGFFDGKPVTVIGHQKGKDTKDNIKRNFGSAYPEGYRKALRLMKQAEKFNRPVVIFIDTPAAYPGIGAEERGQAEAIAFNIYEMSALKTPVIAFVIGEGGSGGALGLGVADRVFMLTNTFYSVIPPEGCASILWKDPKRSGEAAEALKIDPDNLLGFNVIDAIIEEPVSGAHEDYEGVMDNVGKILSETIKELSGTPLINLVEQRYNKFRKIGKFIN